MFRFMEEHIEAMDASGVFPDRFYPVLATMVGWAHEVGLIVEVPNSLERQKRILRERFPDKEQRV